MATSFDKLAKVFLEVGHFASAGTYVGTSEEIVSVNGPVIAIADRPSHGTVLDDIKYIGVPHDSHFHGIER